VQFRRLVRETLAGRTVALTVWREGRAQNLNVTLSTRRDSICGRVSVMPDFRLDLEPMLRYRIEPRIEQLFRYSATPRLGIGGQDLSGQLGQYFGAPEGAGVLVTEVAAGTPAEKAGIKAGDVIIKMDGVRVRNLEDLRERMRAAREKGSTSVTLLRKGSEMTLNVQIEKPEPLRRPTVSRRIAI
jgi:serine protease Do